MTHLNANSSIDDFLKNFECTLQLLKMEMFETTVLCFDRNLRGEVTRCHKFYHSILTTATNRIDFGDSVRTSKWDAPHSIHTKPRNDQCRMVGLISCCTFFCHFMLSALLLLHHVHDIETPNSKLYSIQIYSWQSIPSKFSIASQFCGPGQWMNFCIIFCASNCALAVRWTNSAIVMAVSVSTWPASKVFYQHIFFFCSFGKLLAAHWPCLVSSEIGR